ncbi:MAG TPA: extracellular solute-binding protein, partial [Beijerinckiaceae bacterium]
MRTLRRLLALLSCALASSAQAATEIVWWHAMVDANRAAVEQLADEFNRSQRDYVVKPQYKGVYSETLAAGLAAFEEGDAPHILQVVEVGTATMMAATGAVKPIHEVMRDARQYFEPRSYLPAIVGYYSTASGEMLSFPFNSSSAVMWVNKDALTRAGLGGAKLTTWPEVFDAAARLRANGHESCGFSSAWITWIMIEQFSA